MTANISRDTSWMAHVERYTRVVQHQGAALLDANLNEQSAIHHDFLRTFIADSMGRGWRPALGSGGFELQAITGEPRNFRITPGHFYVDGILCDNRKPGCSYSAQPFLPTPPPLPAGKDFVAYIECWERHVSAVQRPELREIALGAADSASRIQIVWQVRAANADLVEAQKQQLLVTLPLRSAALAAIDKDESDALTALQGTLAALAGNFVGVMGVPAGPAVPFEDQARDWFEAMAATPPRLRAMARREAADNDACTLAPESRYRGRENQLYRVEIHDGGIVGMADKPSFKWSRENGSVLFAVRAGESVKVEANLITVPLETLGQDRRCGLCTGDWVELTSDAFELDGVAPSLGKVMQIDRTRRQVEIEIDPADKTDFSDCTLLRRWDQKEQVGPRGTLAITETGATNADIWTPLERGVQVQFQPGGLYRTGDCWLIPARESTNGVLWPGQPGGPPVFMPPQGSPRHRAAIGQGPV